MLLVAYDGVGGEQIYRAGQTVRIEIEGIGTLSNPVIEEPENQAMY